MNCALCGTEVVIAKPIGTHNRFCCKAHKYEYHNNCSLSKSQVEILTMLKVVGRNAVVALPKSNTVYALSDENTAREFPLIERAGYKNKSQGYRITSTGKKFLKLMLDRE